MKGCVDGWMMGWMSGSLGEQVDSAGLSSVCTFSLKIILTIKTVSTETCTASVEGNGECGLPEWHLGLFMFSSALPVGPRSLFHMCGPLKSS